MQYLQRLWALPNDLKHNEASFLTVLTDLLCLRVAQMPRSPDLCAKRQTNRQEDTTDYFSL